MSWGQPQAFWLFGLLALGYLIALGWRRLGRRQQRSLGFERRQLRRGQLPRLRLLRSLLAWGGLSLVVLALARPQWGAHSEERLGRGANLAVLIDCSRSMLAEDQFPNRLEAARRKAVELLQAAPEHRVALIPFAATALVRSPLTGDQMALTRLLESCSPQLFAVQGTAIGVAVKEAIKFLQRQEDRGRAIVIFSDGSDQDQEAVAAAIREAAIADIPVYGLFFGDPSSTATIEIDGQRVPVPATRQTLDDFAAGTQAISVNATPGPADIQALQDHISQRVPSTPWREQQQQVSSERYQLALWPAVGLLIAALCIPLGRRSPPSVKEML